MIDSFYLEHKKDAMKKLQTARKQNKVDIDALLILDRLNLMDAYYTTSSCSGRIVVMQLKDLGDKKSAVFHGKWHRSVESNEVTDAIGDYTKGQLWFLAQPPIFHVGCRSLDVANELVIKGVSSGFKHSGIKTVSDKIIVELSSTERMDIPFGMDGHVFVDESLIPLFVMVANKVIMKAKQKVHRLEESLA